MHTCVKIASENLVVDFPERCGSPSLKLAKFVEGQALVAEGREKHISPLRL